MEYTIELIKKKYPEINFKVGKSFYWSSIDQTIYYQKKYQDSDKANWTLFHEVGHALLDHKNYSSDYSLIQMEIDAWNKAIKIANSLNIKIDPEHIEECLDTYRDWLHKRSQCPKCRTSTFQDSDIQYYTCFNCQFSWKTSQSKICRPYRLGLTVNHEALI